MQFDKGSNYKNVLGRSRLPPVRNLLHLLKPLLLLHFPRSGLQPPYLVYQLQIVLLFAQGLIPDFRRQIFQVRCFQVGSGHYFPNLRLVVMRGLFQLGFLARDLSLELTVRVALQVRLFESPGLSLPVLQLLARVRVTKGRMLTLVLGKHL